MTVESILNNVKNMGYSVNLEGENIRLRYLGVGTQPPEAQELIEALRARKAEAVEYLKARRPLPTLDENGRLERLPFGADPRFFYWREAGQSVAQTEDELKKVFLH